MIKNYEITISPNYVSNWGINEAIREILQNAIDADKNGYKKYENIEKAKIVRRHIHEEWNEQFRDNRLSEKGKELYKRRKEHVERSFADSKQNHGYRYAMYKGIKKNQNYTWLICAAQNMKNIALKKEKVSEKSLTNSILLSIIDKIGLKLQFFFLRNG